MDSRKKLGRMMNRARTDAGLQQQDVAKEMGISQVTLSQWETGLRDVPAHRFLEFCQAIGVDPNTVSSFTEEVHPQLRKKPVSGVDLHRYLECLHRRIRQQQVTIRSLGRTGV